jgi:uncharacterized protein YndB with AHSA1/START domain
MSTFDRVLVEIVVAAPIDAVWRALREPEQIRHWFGWEYPGLKEEVDWIVAALQSGEAGGPRRELRVAELPDRYVLEAADASHTIVRVVRSAPVTDATWRGIYDDTLEGWLTFTQQLRFLLERHDGATRRTLFLNGRATAAGRPVPVEALGLEALAVVPVGERYDAVLPWGERIDGDVWYRAPYQLGITIDGYADGLVAISTRPRTEKSPHGGGAVLLNTYGLDDGRFDQIRGRWATWWKEEYEVIAIHPAV